MAQSWLWDSQIAVKKKIIILSGYYCMGLILLSYQWSYSALAAVWGKQKQEFKRWQRVPWEKDWLKTFVDCGLECKKTENWEKQSTTETTNLQLIWKYCHQNLFFFFRLHKMSLRKGVMNPSIQENLASSLIFLVLPEKMRFSWFSWARN